MKLIKMITVFMALTFSANAAPEKAMTKDLALGGYCPVCYIAAGKANMGTDKFTSELNGKTYQFVSAGTKAMFDKEPAKFLPQYDGYCAFGMSLGKKFESDPTVFTVIEGKIYLNKNAEVKGLFSKDTSSHLVKADAQWKVMAMKKKEMEMKEKAMKK